MEAPELEVYTAAPEQEVQIDIDFKLVTFKLAGKDYGVDIMKVKEISKEKQFTYVPNTPPYVRGVHNLRGEIIPVIDLRQMFYLPIEEDGRVQEEMIILRLEDELVIGTIVDSIDKVLGISSDTIQPPHPLFGDINIKYIQGVVEHEDRLYIILDADRIFGESAGEMPRQELPLPAAVPAAGMPAAEADPTYTFIAETLKTFSSFYVTDLNKKWTLSRFAEWQKRRQAEGLEVQLQSAEDAQEFLKGFYSPHTGQLWGDAYAGNIGKMIPESIEGLINIWNPGCGRGLESYALATVIKQKYPQNQLRIWAHDVDLINISSAPSLILSKEQIPQYIVEDNFVKQNAQGYVFTDVIKDSIVFEYHNIMHRNEYPSADIILARDILSFLEPADQERVIEEFLEKLKTGGLLILGQNETIQEKGWTRVVQGDAVAYKKVKP